MRGLIPRCAAATAQAGGRFKTSLPSSLAVLAVAALTLTSAMGGVTCDVGVARAAPGDDAWSADFHLPGLDGVPYAYAEWRGDLIVAGAFGAAGPTLASRIARYDGAAWHALGEGLDGTVRDLAVWGEDLVACGEFTHAGGVAAAHVVRWDGTAWHALGESVPAGVRALAVYQGDLYCDRFRWDGAAWVDVLQTNGGVVYDFIERDGLLVAGGAFTTAGGLATGHVVAWDGTAVVNAYPGQGSPVVDLEAWEGQLFALRLDGSYNAQESPVARWQAGGWSGTPGLDPAKNEHTALALRGEQLVLGAAGVDYAQFFHWDGSHWVGEDYVWLAHAASLCAWGKGLLVGGSFSAWRGVAARNLVLLAGPIPVGLVAGGLGVSGNVLDLAAGDHLAVGGAFTTAGRTVTTGVAEWSGDGWSPRSLDGTWIGQRLGWHAGVLNCLVEVESEFVSCRHQRWQTGGWSPTWSEAPDVPRGRLVSWSDRLMAVWRDTVYDATDPLGWSVFAQATGGWISAAVGWGDWLVVSGDFTAIDGVPAEGLAVCDGNAWQPLAGPGWAQGCRRLAVWQDRLVAVGSAFGKGGDLREQIAVLDGGVWSWVAEDVDGLIDVLAASAGRLYAGGSFHGVDGVAADNIACWDGQAWRPLGSGVNGTVRALASFGGRLWVGGYFSRAGGRPAAHLCTWRDEAVPAFLRSLAARRLPDGHVRVSWEVGEAREGEYVLERTAGDRASVALPAVAAEGRTRFEQLDTAAPAWGLVYRLRHRATAGGPAAGELLGEAAVPAQELPAATRLLPPAPNPFNPAVALRFELARPGLARLAVYDARGRRLATLLDEHRPAGAHEATWRGTDAQGRPQPSGVYFVRLEADGAARTVKLTLAR